MDFEELFPHVKHSVESFLFDEEGNIPRSKILTIGSMMIILSMLFTEKAYAFHRTHSSHRTHSTHRTHSSHSSGGHTTHYTHSTHSTHSTHGTHNTHSNHSTHSTHSDHASHVTHSNHSTHSNAAPTNADLIITPPSSADTVAAAEARDLGVSMGAVLPTRSVDPAEGIEASIGAEIKIPPSTPRTR